MNGGRVRAAARWCIAPEHRWYVLAVVVGFALRLGWVLWVHAVEPLEATSDAGRNLTMARQFSTFETYRLNGLVSAFNPPGYAFLLTPVAWLSRGTGWFEMPVGAALVNVGAGTATVALGGVLGHQWFGPRGRTVAAWILAVAAGPIYLTVVALTETVFTAVVLAALVLISRLVLAPGRSASTPVVVALGGLVGFVTLVRGPGLLLVALAVLAVRVAAGSWRDALRPAVAVVGVTAVVLLPWMVRNAVQVGTYTPVATNSAAFLCQGHGEHARADVEDMSPADFAECFAGSPFDPRDPDEADWADRISRRAVSWALRHPVEEVELTWDKTYATLVNDHQALADAADGARRELAAPSTLERLDRLGEYWHRAVLALGLLGLVLTPAVRRAWPLWAGAAGFVAVVWVGNALDRYHHTTMALLAVMAAGFLVSLPSSRAGVRVVAWAGDDGRRRSRHEALAALAEPGAPPRPEDGLAQAARPTVPVIGVPEAPVHPWFASVAVAAWVATLGFDLVSQVADQAWAYARGAFVLTGLGVLGGVASAVTGTLDLRAVPRGTVAHRIGVRHLLAMDLCLAVFAASFLLRRSSDFAVDEGVALLPMALSGLGLVVLAVGVRWGRTLVHTHGVRVSAGEERRRGFEPGGDDDG